MANDKNLIPFKKGQDSRRNTNGANAKNITKYLQEFGALKSIQYHIELTNGYGQTKTVRGRVTGKGKNGHINQIIATQLLAKAIKGDLRAIQEVLDRTEGKPKQGIEFQDFSNMDITIEYIDNDL